MYHSTKLFFTFECHANQILVVNSVTSMTLYVFKLISQLSLLAFANPRHLRVPPPVALGRCLLLFLFDIYVINNLS
jgi:hypothetical protein